QVKAAQVEPGFRIGHGVSSFPDAMSLHRCLEYVTNPSAFIFAFPVPDRRMVQMDVNPRKIPRQSRARATVRAIIQATAQVLVHAGFERMTTAMVA
ncbi:hypothetical protein, partial [Paracoccus versutus]|uniref:hypothetical protein n=1 Tax=Paracoccus versutus TaxID=34007 RepID=UPI001C6935B8